MDIAALMRVPIDELPWQLAHVGQWTTAGDTKQSWLGGMHHESVKDPMDDIVNPWNDELYVRVVINGLPEKTINIAIYL